MKRTIAFYSLVMLFSIMMLHVQAQQDRPDIYDPDADAGIGLKEAITNASTHGKHVLVMVGGNW